MPTGELYNCRSEIHLAIAPRSGVTSFGSSIIRAVNCAPTDGGVSDPSTRLGLIEGKIGAVLG